VSLDNVKASPGDTVVVPLRSFNLTNVGAISLKINYDSSVLQFVGLQDDSVGFTSSSSSGVVTLGWFANNNTPIDIVDGIMTKLVFKYVDNSTPLQFFLFNGQTEITDINNVIIPVTYINGSVAKDRSISIPDLTARINTQVAFPVSVTNIEVGSASLKINFDPSVLTFKEIANSAGDGVSANAVGGVLTIGYYDAAPSFGTGKLFDIVFTYAGGNSAITFDQINSEITAADGGIYSGFDYNDGSISLKPDSKPMFISTMPDTSIAEGSTLMYTYVAADADTEDVVKYSLVNPPAGAVIDSLTGVFSWTPGFDQANTYNIVAVATDGILSDTSTTTIVIVTNVDRPPVFTSFLKDTTITENQTLNFTYIATDPDLGDTITYSLQGTPPVGVSIDSKTGAFTWTPSYDQANSYSIVVGASDGTLTASDTTKITVLNENRKPSFTSSMNDTTIQSNNVDTLKFQYAATDPDGQALTFGLINPPSGATISSSGLLTFVVPKDTAQDLNYNINVFVTDGMDTVSTSAVVTVEKFVGILDEGGLPNDFSLAQNYPNPFNPTTNIKFSFPHESKVILKIYNSIGQEVATLINDILPAGNYRYEFNASKLPSGFYIYSINAGNFVSTKKMLLLK
jgi:hypothetical protein